MRRLVMSLCLLASLGGALSLAGGAADAAGRHGQRYLLALGDSYAVGYQAPIDRTTLHGPANQLVALAARRGLHLKLIDLGCAGATTASMLTERGCPAGGMAPGAPPYPRRTQLQAAVAFLRAHRGQVAMVTVSIGGNDVDGCIPQPDPLTCVAARMPAAVANLKRIVRALRAAGGARLPIVGSTYPDVVLGAWVRGDVFKDGYTLAAESLTAFRYLINPGLRRAYASAHAHFVDVTAATGAYGPFYAVKTPAYGPIPEPVAAVCRLTFFCRYLDIHMTTAGYGIIARLEAEVLFAGRAGRG